MAAAEAVAQVKDAAKEATASVAKDGAAVETEMLVAQVQNVQP